MTPNFSDLLAARYVSLDLTARSDQSAIEDIARSLATHPAVVNVERFAAEVWEREQLSTTALGSGVAFPHARTDQVREIVLAAGRSTEGILFDGTGERVHLIFVLGTPPERGAEYLALVARLARLLKNEAIRAGLMAAPDADRFLQVLRSGG